MKLVSKTVGLLLSVLLVQAAGPRARAQVPTSGTLTVSALIDGRSRLYVTPTGIYWQHQGWAGPGLLGNSKLPTKVALDGPQRFAADWCPVWSNGCNTCDGSCGDLRDQPLRSNPLLLDLFAGPLVRHELGCQGRERCVLGQVPTAANGYTAAIDFDDGLSPGADTYTATFRYEFCLPPACDAPDGGPPPSIPDAAAPRDSALDSRPPAPGPDARASLVPDAELEPAAAPASVRAGAGGCACSSAGAALPSAGGGAAISALLLLAAIGRARRGGGRSSRRP